MSAVHYASRKLVVLQQFSLIRNCCVIFALIYCLASKILGGLIELSKMSPYMTLLVQ